LDVAMNSRITADGLMSIVTRSRRCCISLVCPTYRFKSDLMKEILLKKKVLGVSLYSFEGSFASKKK
jgi:hypothetical protein